MASLNSRFEQVVKAIEARGIMPASAPSLDPMTKALNQIIDRTSISLPSDKIIVVAGTNGKGSVCATLQALLGATGARVGMYTSPHLESITERIQINQEPISREVFIEAYSEITRLIPEIKLSHFEILTLMAVWIFYSGKPVAKVDWGIFEVGLGGTWDATNAIPHQTSVITSLGLDHQNLLGATLEEIASNKFGIIHSGNRVISGPLQPELEKLKQETIQSTNCNWELSSIYPYAVETAPAHSVDTSPKFILRTPWGAAPLSLPGKRGAENTSLALAIFSSLGFTPQLYLGALQKVKWPGRMERIVSARTKAPVYLSGDHNPAGIASLIELLKFYPRKNLYILAGIGRDKDLDGVLQPLFELENTKVFLTETPFKGRPIAEYGKWSKKAIYSNSNPETALNHLLEKATSEDLVLVTGSLYLVGLIRGLL